MLVDIKVIYFYIFHSIEFSRYSKYNPIIRIKRNSSVEAKIKIVGVEVSVIRGINKIISVSKIKKMILIKKNWILNGRRLNDSGSNPHSNGDIFSYVIMVFLYNVKLIIMIREGINIIIILIITME